MCVNSILCKNACELNQVHNSDSINVNAWIVNMLVKGLSVHEMKMDIDYCWFHESFMGL